MLNCTHSIDGAGGEFESNVQDFFVTMGKYSQAVIGDNEVAASVGRRATNDLSEGTFATFVDILCNVGNISLLSAIY
jgi:hypothetical protein